MAQQSDPQAIKERQRQEWDAAAAGWRKNDERLRQLTTPVTQRLLELASIEPGHRVLDIACGTGEPALPAADVVGTNGYVLGTDISAEMLAVARDKAQDQGLTNVEFRQVDAEELEAEPDSFDAVTCRWGIMFMPNPTGCLRRAHSALKPGGRIALSVWGKPERNPWIALPVMVLRKYVDMPTPQPGEPGILAFADGDRLVSTLREAGFRDVEIEEMELPMAVFESGREYWQQTREIAAPIAAVVERLSADLQRTVGEEIAAAAGGGDPDGKVSLNGCPLLATGVK